MKKLVLIAAFSIGVSFTHGQEYKVVCKRLNGCPVINGTCPTCEIVGIGKSQTELDTRLEKVLKAYRAEYNKKYGSDSYKKERTIKPGWEWKGPTWRGLRVLF